MARTLYVGFGPEFLDPDSYAAIYDAAIRVFLYFSLNSVLIPKELAEKEMRGGLLMGHQFALLVPMASSVLIGSFEPDIQDKALTLLEAHASAFQPPAVFTAAFHAVAQLPLLASRAASVVAVAAANVSPSVPVLTVLASSLASSAPAVRLAAVAALAAISDLERALFPYLLARLWFALFDLERDIAARAADLLALLNTRVQPESYAAQLLPLLDDTDEKIRAIAGRSIAGVVGLALHHLGSYYV